MQIEPLTFKEDEYTIHTIITQPTLFKMTYGQGCLVEEFKVDKDCSYLGILDTHDLIGLFQLKEFNKITYDAHIYILPRYQDGTLSVKAVRAGKEYLHDTTDISQIITSVPYNCEYVHKFLYKTDFKVCGKVPNGIIYNQQIQDLILYNLNIR